MDGPVPTVVFFHGGGFVIGDLDTHEGVCRQLCRDVGAVVVSVDYRLAPEHRFPAAVEDAEAAVRWVVENVDEYGGDRRRIAVGGDSAGGNLAAVAAQILHADGIELAAQLLVYPAVDFLEDDYPSRTENAEGYFLTLEDMHWFAEQYTGLLASDPRDREVASDPRLSPLYGRARGPAAGRRGDGRVRPAARRGRRLRRRAREGGRQGGAPPFAGLIHGFYGLELISPAAAEATAWINSALKDLLG